MTSQPCSLNSIAQALSSSLQNSLTTVSLSGMSQRGKPKPLVGGSRPGRLVIVGSGIKSIAHLTLEAVGYPEEADKVFYTVADGSSAAFILSKNAQAVDLYNLYDIGKPRYETYVQMARSCSARYAVASTLGAYSTAIQEFSSTPLIEPLRLRGMKDITLLYYQASPRMPACSLILASTQPSQDARRLKPRISC